MNVIKPMESPFVNRAAFLASFVAAIFPAPLAAQVSSSPAPEIFTRVVACRSVADEAQRLACFDREVSTLAQAQASKEIVVVDQEQIRETRRSLFGLSLPNIGRVFSHEEGPREITAKIAGASVNGMGRWTLTLDDGSVWDQTESRLMTRDPRAGMEVRIRQAALGSYMANIDGQRGIRVSRRR